MFQRKRQATWDRRHLVTVSCRIGTGEYALLQEYAEEHGTTIYGLVSTYLRALAARQRSRSAPKNDQDWGELCRIR